MIDAIFARAVLQSLESSGLSGDELLKDDSGAGHVFTKVNEHAQLWTYRAWAEWLAAESWQELKERHSLVPDNV